jgi:nucleoside-diphosphate-sugar epimerase
MPSTHDPGTGLVTGACGHLGRAVCSLLGNAGRKFLPIDVSTDSAANVEAGDLRSEQQLSKVFQARPVRAVIHLAGVLPTAFCLDPLAGAETNLSGTLALMRHAVHAQVERFVFASSMSVYGSFSRGRRVTEQDATAPDEPYGASKRAVELIGQALAKQAGLEFVSLRIARVIGPGTRKTSSPWRAQIFEPPSRPRSIEIPFSPEATLSLVHVNEVARMLVTLTDALAINSTVYNTPAEVWKATNLKATVEQVAKVSV